MSDIGEYNAAAANFATSAMQSTANLAQSTFDFKATKKLARYQADLNKELEQYNHNRKMQSFRDAAQAARNGGFSPLAALGQNTMSSPQELSSSVSPYHSAGMVAPDFSSSLLLQKQLEKMDADIASTKTDNAIKQSSLDASAGVNTAINDKLKALGFDVPINQSEGFLRGISQFDSYLAESDDRALKRLANDNQRFLEKLKASPEAQKKMTEGFYAELEKSLVSLEDQKTLLQGHKLDNTKKFQDIEIGGVQYRLVQAELYSKMYDNQVIKPLETAKLESDVASAQANSEYLMFKLDSEKWKYSNQQQKSNPWYWYDLRDEEFKNGNYYEASKSWFLGGLYLLPDIVGSGLSKLVK